MNVDIHNEKVWEGDEEEEEEGRRRRRRRKDVIKMKLVAAVEWKKGKEMRMKKKEKEE